MRYWYTQPSIVLVKICKYTLSVRISVELSEGQKTPATLAILSIKQIEIYSFFLEICGFRIFPSADWVRILKNVSPMMEKFPTNLLYK